MINSNEGAPMIDEIVRAVAREYAWPGFFPEEKTAPASPETLQAYVGSYAAGSLSCAVTREGDRLFLRAATQPALELRPTAENTFKLLEVDAEVVFDRRDGLVKGLEGSVAGAHAPPAPVATGTDGAPLGASVSGRAASVTAPILAA
jgi:hypothetical protein